MARLGRRYPQHRIFPNVVFRIPMPPSNGIRRLNYVPITHRMVNVGKSTIQPPVVTSPNAAGYKYHRPVNVVARGRAYQSAAAITTPIANSVNFRVYHPSQHIAGAANRIAQIRTILPAPVAAPVARLMQHMRPIINSRQQIIFRSPVRITNPPAQISRPPQDSFRRHHSFVVSQNRRTS
jgi:hypothetical protein